MVIGTPPLVKVLAAGLRARACPLMKTSRTTRRAAWAMMVGFGQALLAARPVSRGGLIPLDCLHRPLHAAGRRPERRPCPGPYLAGPAFRSFLALSAGLQCLGAGD